MILFETEYKDDLSFYQFDQILFQKTIELIKKTNCSLHVIKIKAKLFFFFFFFFKDFIKDFITLKIVYILKAYMFGLFLHKTM